MLSTLSLLYYRRSVNGEDVDDLDNIIIGCEEARVEDLERAIAANLTILSTATSAYRHKAIELCVQSWLVYRRFQLLGFLEDLHDAILANEEAVAAAPLREPRMLSHLGFILSTRFERLGALEDIDKAISVTAESVAATPADDLELADRLQNLSLRHHNRFDRFGELENLDHPIKFMSEELAATLPAHAKRADSLRLRSGWVYRRFERLGVLDDLDNSILAIEEAVAVAPSTDPVQLSYLGVLVYKRYQRVGA